MIDINKRIFSKNLISLTIGLCLISILSVAVGSQGITPLISPQTDNNEIIIYFRLNRILSAIITGSSLAVSGASLQALFQNPLADPHIFGISGGAALGASLVFAFFAESMLIAPKVGAIIGSIISFLIIFYFLRGVFSGLLLNHCLLVGALINILASSIITIIKTVISPEKTQNLLFWLVGNFTIIEKSEFLIIVPLWLLGLYLITSIRGELDIMSFGAIEADLLGIDPKKIVRIAVIGNCILIGNVVSFSGMIGFLGLVVPHLMRLLSITNFRYLIPMSMIAGAILLVFFDMISRVGFLIFATEIPVGAICAIFLSPIFFMLLIFRGHNEQYQD